MFGAMEMIIRKYNSADCAEMAQLFYNTVHTVNARDYTQQQLNAWATGKVDLVQWNESFCRHFTFVAVMYNKIVGFGDIDNIGYLDRLYVHKDYQRQGIGSELCEMLEKAVQGNIVTHASITAKAFFESRGYSVIKQQTVVKNDVQLTNFVMTKKRV